VTLHTGLGTFRPIEVEDLSKHKMDAEYYKIDETAYYCKQSQKKAITASAPSVQPP
jgi:S-adenosylmethionine:tRNA-ribosyltransferase-isomerase (queuine synthetase)